MKAPSTQVPAVPGTNGARATPPSIPRSKATIWLVILALTIGFGLLGSRPLWEPDEGRYANVALVMLESGNWVDPMRNQDIEHWTKPPMTYWAPASSFGVHSQHCAIRSIRARRQVGDSSDRPFRRDDRPLVTGRCL